MIKSLPGTWDETIALPPSEIGEVPAVARRHGATWAVAVPNGPTARTLRIDLGFPGRRRYDAHVVRDQADDPAAVGVEKTAIAGVAALTLERRRSSGFIARLGPNGESRIPNGESR